MLHKRYWTFLSDELVYGISPFGRNDKYKSYVYRRVFGEAFAEVDFSSEAEYFKMSINFYFCIF